jgi:hypothetical protein
MSYQALFLGVVVLLMTSPEWGRGPHSTLVKRSVEIGPSTVFELITRAKATGAGGWNSGFTESSLEPSAVRPGDDATVTIERAGHQRKAVWVQIVRPANG